MSNSICVLSDPILAECDNGAVAICPCCGRPVLWYGECHVTLKPRQLRAMLATVRQVCEEVDRPGVCWGWSLRARTAHEDVTFELTPDDTVELAGLLEAAAVALDLDALLVDVFASDPM